MSLGFYILGYLLAFISAITIFPQFLKIYKHRIVDGVSFNTASFAIATMLLWSLYTAHVKDLPAFLSSILPLIIWSGILILLGVHGEIRYDLLSLYLIFYIFILALSFLGYSNYFGLVASIFSSLYVLPQVVKAIRDSNINGVSFTAWFAIFIENILWVIYAIGRGNMTYAYAPIIQGPASLIISILVVKKRKNSGV